MQKTWEDRVADAIESGRFTRQDMGLAKDWNTCACGRHLNIARDGEGVPTDEILAALGCKFLSQVGFNNAYGARYTLGAINRRIAEMEVAA